MADIARAWRTKEQIEQEREAQAWASLRTERDRRLAATDWIMLPDAPLPPGTTREQWQAYRQALRDVPQQPGAPWHVEWPEPPGVEAGSNRHQLYDNRQYVSPYQPSSLPGL